VASDQRRRRRCEHHQESSGHVALPGCVPRYARAREPDRSQRDFARAGRHHVQISRYAAGTRRAPSDRYPAKQRRNAVRPPARAQRRTCSHGFSGLAAPRGWRTRCCTPRHDLRMGWRATRLGDLPGTPAMRRRDRSAPGAARRRLPGMLGHGDVAQRRHHRAHGGPRRARRSAARRVLQRCHVPVRDVLRSTRASVPASVHGLAGHRRRGLRRPQRRALPRRDRAPMTRCDPHTGHEPGSARQPPAGEPRGKYTRRRWRSESRLTFTCNASGS